MVKVGQLYRRNHPIEPVGCVRSNFGDNGDQLYLVPSNFSNWLSFLRWAMWKADQTSWLDLRGEGKKSMEGNG